MLGLTNASGSLVDHYTYTPYGQQTVLAQAVPNLFGYDGGLMVAGTPLIHFGARYADPALGLWTQLDPSGQSPAYVFAGANPVNYTDLSGLYCYTCTLAVSTAIGGGAGAVIGGWVGFSYLNGIGLGPGIQLGSAIGQAGGFVVGGVIDIGHAIYSYF